MGHIRRNILYLTVVYATLHLHIVMAGMHTDRSDEECDQVRTKVIAYEDLKRHGLGEYSRPDTTDYSQIVIDEENNQIIVGAKDTLLQLSLQDLSPIQETVWRPSDLMVDICQSKGERPEDCCNFIRVLLPYKDKIFTCGTNAFSPLCSWRKRNNVTEVESELSGIARCPYDPRFNATALLTKEGDLYSGTVMDFTARDPVVYRTLGPSPALRTAQLNSKWLSEPNFVSSYEIGSYVYFFFREVAVEKSSCGRVIYSRVARVCKNDVGGEFLLEENWTTFMKATLNCSVSEKSPLHFDELVSTYYSEETQTVYGVFSSKSHGVHGSAVCSFRLSDIDDTFRGPFKFQPDPRSPWVTQRNPNPNFNCSAVDSENTEFYLDEDHLLAAQKYQLMDQAVPPAPRGLILVSTNKHYQLDHIMVDHVQGQNQIYDVMFLGTSNGKIKKVFKIPETSEVCVLEDMCVTPKSKCDPLKSIKLHSGSGALYVGLPTAVIKVPVQRCGSFPTEVACIESRDPYCGWNVILGQCTTRPESQVELTRWYQNITSCPTVSNRVDGGFSDWSEWLPCDDPSGVLSSCTCRTRECTNPAPKCGGDTCQGERVQVKNCSGRRGQTSNEVDEQDMWSEWTEWSSCTQKCGGGVQSRDRRCLDGTSCIGSSQELRVCNTFRCSDRRKASVWTPWLVLNVSDDGLLQQRFRFICRAPIEERSEISLSSPKNQVRLCPYNSQKCIGDKYTVDGRWSCWSDWSECSVTCGMGVRTRERLCNSPIPQNGGADCDGPTIEEGQCDAGECEEEPVLSSMNWGIEVRAGPRGEDLSVGDGENGWKTWSKWSKCSVKGKKHRSRKCSESSPSIGFCEGCVKEIAWCVAAGEKEDEVTHLRPDVQRLVAPKPECFTAEEESEQELIFLLVVAILSAIAGAIIAVAGYISWQRKRGPSGSSTIELDDYGDDMYEDEDIFVEDEFPYEDYVPHGGREIPSDNKTVAVNETR
ncbi:semaphorin-5A-like isoform X2 [Apostichopus japonicus]|uniref:semaphorin-5A-like isoform X2 n=1 Tax=Stichopus japonicus TaxID=307972 RepID=UPI003AB8DF46